MSVERHLDKERVLKTWLFRGLSDIYFAFDVEDCAFESNARFSEIVGLEKVLKAALLYSSYEKYESLEYIEAKKTVDKLARNWSHGFNKMLDELDKTGLIDLKELKQKNYDGYEGGPLIQVLEKGYMETRYPVSVEVSDSFPIGNGWYQDPLSSSGMTKFIYDITAKCFFELSKRTDLADVLRELKEKFQHRESFHRFNNLVSLKNYKNMNSKVSPYIGA